MEYSRWSKTRVPGRVLMGLDQVVHTARGFVVLGPADAMPAAAVARVATGVWVAQGGDGPGTLVQARRDDPTGRWAANITLAFTVRAADEGTDRGLGIVPLGAEALAWARRALDGLMDG